MQDFNLGSPFYIDEVSNPKQRVDINQESGSEISNGLTRIYMKKGGSSLPIIAKKSFMIKN